MILTGIKELVIIPPLESPRQDGSNGGQIIKIGFLSILIGLIVQIMSQLYQLRCRYRRRYTSLNIR